MIGVDANLLLRLVLQDDDEQLATVRQAMSSAIQRGEELVIGPIALVETVWTLITLRRPSRAALFEAVTALIETPPLRAFDDQIVRRALALLEAGPAGFSDCLIRAMDDAAGCTATLTFDRNALKLPGFAHP